jgi:hypothetical protein
MSAWTGCSPLPPSAITGKPNLTVWTFSAAESARRALEALRGVLTIDEAAVIEWRPERSEPETREFYRLDGNGSRSRIWRTVFPAVFDGEQRRLELFDDRSLARVREHVQPGTSMLFVLTRRDGP